MIGIAAGNERAGDDAGGFLRIVAAMHKTQKRGRKQLHAVRTSGRYGFCCALWEIEQVVSFINISASTNPNTGASDDEKYCRPQPETMMESNAALHPWCRMLLAIAAPA